MKKEDIFAFGLGTANQGEQSQLIGALEAIASFYNKKVDINKQLLLPENVKNLQEMKDSISFFNFPNYKCYKEYLYKLLDNYFKKNKAIPRIFIKVFTQAENDKAFDNVDMTCKAIKEYYKEKNLGYIFTTVLTSKYYKYEYVDLINIPKHLLNFSSRIRLLQNKALRKKTLITIGTINHFSKELIKQKYDEFLLNIEKYKNNKNLKSIIEKFMVYKKEKKHIVFCLGGRVEGQEIRFDLNFAKKIFNQALGLKNIGYGIIFVNGARTPNDVCDFLYEMSKNDDKIIFCNCKRVAKTIEERSNKYWRIYSGKYEKIFSDMLKLGNIYPGISGIKNTAVVHTFDSFSGCDTAVVGIPTVICVDGIYVNKSIRYDCHNLVQLLCPKYALDWNDFFKLALNMKIEPKNLHPSVLSSSLKVFAEAIVNRLDRINL